MDVLCVGMYRACSTWQYEVVSQLVERHRGGRRLGYMLGEEYAELVAREGHDRGWRVLKSHEEHPAFARALAEGRAVAVYSYRDLRDVVYSMLHKRGVGFDEFFRQGMIHQILANDRFWSHRPRRISQRYEDLISDPASGVAALADHLGIELAPGEASRIAEEYSLEANRRRTEEVASRLRSQGIDLEDPANRQRWDETTLLHWNHLRSGRVGDWRERATPHERAVLARIVNGWLVRHGYEPDEPRYAFPAGLREHVAMSRARLACALRCASLRHPNAARVVKRLLGIPTELRPAGGRASAVPAKAHIPVGASTPKARAAD